MPGVLTLMAHAGIGDSFPVGEEDKPKAFEVKVVAGAASEFKLNRIFVHTEHRAGVALAPR